MYILLILITIISSLVSLGYSISALRGAKKNPTAYYAFVRSVATLILIVTALIIANQPLVLGAAYLMALIQLGDGIVGILIRDKLKTYGPFFVAIVSFIFLFIYTTSQ